jgi:integrase
MALGSCAAISLADAVKEAKAHAGAVARGHDPFEERQAKTRDEYPLRELIDSWQELRLKPHNKPGYADEAPAALRRVFKKYLNTAAAKLDRVAVVRVHNEVAREAPAMAARIIAYGGAAFSWAIKCGTLKDSPFTRIPIAPTTQRERVLNDLELTKLWRSTESDSTFDVIVRLLILTGQRRGEVSGMTWGEIATDGTAWTLPSSRVKNSVSHVVPLSTQARAVIAARPRGNADQLVFPGRNGVTGFDGWGKSKARLDRDSGITRWTLHDLRRTVATNLQKLGVRLEVTEAILNHVSGSRSGIVGVYQKYTWDTEKRDALQRWADRLDDIVNGRVTDNVVTLRA